MNSKLKAIMDEYGVLQDYAKGDRLIHQGLPIEWFYILLEGSVKIEQNAPNGKSILLCFYHAGLRHTNTDNPTMEQGDVLFLGDLELYTRDKRANSTVTAVSSLRCCRISAAVMARHAAVDPQVSNSIAESLARKMDAYCRMSAINLLYSLKQRYAWYLAVLSDNNASIPIALEETASLLGTSTRHLQRVLAELEEEGCIRREGRELAVTSKTRLLRQSGGAGASE